MAKILVIEDDAIVRTDIEAILADEGHEVVSCETAEEALVALGDDGAGFDVAVTDLRLTGETQGADLAFRMRDISPSIGLLVSSGYIATDIPSYPAGTAFIGKPFEPVRLLAIVGRLASGREATTRLSHRVAIPAGAVGL